MDDVQHPSAADFEQLPHEQLIALALEQRQLIQQLQKRVAELEDLLGLGGGDPPPAISIKSSRKPKTSTKNQRKPRHLQFTRKREIPTRIVHHMPQACPECGRRLSGGGPGRRRQIVDIEPAPVVVTEHVLHDRWCGVCRKRVRAAVDFSEYASGRRRIGHNLAAWIATLHITARVPLRLVQDLLRQQHNVHISVGEMIALMKLIATKGHNALEQIKQEVRQSSCLHSDETSWRENGQYRCLWSLSTQSARWYHIDEHRDTAAVTRLIGSKFSGTLVTDFYAVYNKILGRHQRCWPHFHRDLEKLRAHPLYDEELGHWIDAVLTLWSKGRQYRAFCLTEPRFGASVFDRRRKRRELEQELTALVEPYWECEANLFAQATLARRAGIFLNELFTFVEYPEVPDDNNAAERAIRPAVILRKVSGGTRSEAGSQTVAALMSLFATWKLRGQEPLRQCHLLLTTP